MIQRFSGATDQDVRTYKVSSVLVWHGMAFVKFCVESLES